MSTDLLLEPTFVQLTMIPSNANTTNVITIGANRAVGSGTSTNPYTLSL